jgi:hypothetical protein
MPNNKLTPEKMATAIEQIDQEIENGLCS